MSLRFVSSSAVICALVALFSPLALAQTPPAPAGTAAPAATAAPATTASPAATVAPAAPVDPSLALVQDAVQKMNADDTTGAIQKLTEAIRINPKSSGAYVLRASIYCQQNKWDLAETDFKMAQELAPNNIVVKFNLVEIKFMQKQYDAAKPGYLALAGDPDMGDLAKYKAYLCDLFGGHEDAAAKELAEFNKVGEYPSYYFSNAAWDLYHKNNEDARQWLVSASNIFALRKNVYYAQSLRQLGYLPLPEPTDKK